MKSTHPEGSGFNNNGKEGHTAGVCALTWPKILSTGKSCKKPDFLSILKSTRKNLT